MENDEHRWQQLQTNVLGTIIWMLHCVIIRVELATNLREYFTNTKKAPARSPGPKAAIHYQDKTLC